MRTRKVKLACISLPHLNMKVILTIVLSFIVAKGSAQTLPSVIYKDTVNHFIINIPAGWRYGINKGFPNLKLIAYRTATDTADKPHETFNLNILREEKSSLSNEFEKVINVLLSSKDFILIKKDTITIQGQCFEWFIESHKNNNTSEVMESMVFMTYRNENTYILTFTAPSKYFETYEGLFHKIGMSLFLIDH